jgi:hypothetical protein
VLVSLAAAAALLGTGHPTLARVPGVSDAPPQVTAPAEPARSFLLSSSPIQNWPYEEPFTRLTHAPEYTFDDVAREVDILTLFVEHYGLPWDAFATAETPPADHPWTQAMLRLAASARAANRPLALQMVLSREEVAGNAGRDERGGLRVDSRWLPKCDALSQSQHQTAYVRYVRWMVETFTPRYVNVAVEIDRFLSGCPAGAGWQRLVDVERRAYDAARAVAPQAIVYFSINAEHLYSDSLTGFDEGLYGQLASLKRDRFGLSTYPSGVRRDGSTHALPADLPADYFDRVRRRHVSEQPLLIAETGWNTESLSLGVTSSCMTLAPSSADTQDAYVRVLFESAERGGIELVTWWSLRDLMPADVMRTCYPAAPAPDFAACQNNPWCIGNNIYRTIAPANPAFGDLVFKGFGTMGLRDYTGAAKRAATRWRDTLARPTAAPVSPTGVRLL